MVYLYVLLLVLVVALVLYLYYRGMEMPHFPEMFQVGVFDPQDPHEMTEPGSYTEFLSEQIEPEVHKNHKEFVKDLVGPHTRNLTDRSRSMATHDSYNPGPPWVGLRRPQAVPIDNPTQVIDVDMSHFSEVPTFSWSSTKETKTKV